MCALGVGSVSLCPAHSIEVATVALILSIHQISSWIIVCLDLVDHDGHRWLAAPLILLHVAEVLFLLIFDVLPRVVGSAWSRDFVLSRGVSLGD